MELNSRARRLLSRYEQAGELAALSDAVQDFRAALAATPDGDSSLAWRQSNLGAALRMLFSRTGEQAYLAEAVSLQRDALSGADDDVRPVGQSNLAGALLDQHRLTGAASPLTEAVALLQEAADGIAADHPERAAILANLAAARSRQPQAEATSDSLAEAVGWHRRAVADALTIAPSGAAAWRTWVAHSKRRPSTPATGPCWPRRKGSTAMR